MPQYYSTCPLYFLGRPPLSYNPSPRSVAILSNLRARICGKETTVPLGSVRKRMPLSPSSFRFDFRAGDKTLSNVIQTLDSSSADPAKKFAGIAPTREYSIPSNECHLLHVPRPIRPLLETIGVEIPTNYAPNFFLIEALSVCRDTAGTQQPRIQSPDHPSGYEHSCSFHSFKPKVHRVHKD